MNQEARIMIIGVGFHARRIYIPTITRYMSDLNVKIVAGVDIDMQKTTIDEYMKKGNYVFDMLYVDQLDNATLTEKSTAVLDEYVDRNRVNGVIISTEPLSHKAYASWALGRGLNILMDKPISTRKNLSTNIVEAENLYEDFQDLLDAYRSLQKMKTTIFSINTQRRYDAGFNKVKALITEVRELFNVPVTSMHAMYADGTWIQPTEILSQQSHPYLHGYGKCSHSSYHIFDIVSQFYLAGLIPRKKPDELETFASFIQQSGFNTQMNFDDYHSYFGGTFIHPGLSEKEYVKTVEAYGEIDAYCMLRLLKDGQNICNISINLLHNSFTRRAWAEPKKDLYKGNGRVKQQEFVIHQGPFQSIHVQNYQANDSHDQDNTDQYHVGGNNHFDILLFRNADMFPGKQAACEKISMKDLQGGHVTGRLTIEKTKDLVILEFIEFILGKVEISKAFSSIETHAMPVRIMSDVYRSNILQSERKNPVVRSSLQDCW